MNTEEYGCFRLWMAPNDGLSVGLEEGGTLQKTLPRWNDIVTLTPYFSVFPLKHINVLLSCISILKRCTVA